MVATLVLIGVSAVVALGPLPVGAAGGEGPVTVAVSDGPPVEFDFGITPKLLPVGEGGVTRLSLGLKESDPFPHGFPIGIATTKVGLDRSIVLEPRGLPVCRRSAAEGDFELEGKVSDECRRAVVGRVETEIFVVYPEVKGVEVRQEGKIYNGGARGRGTNLLIEVPLADPFGGILWIVAKVRPVDEGRLGSELTIKVPKIAEGGGTLFELQLKIGHTFGRDGELVGFVQAHCHGGRLVASQDGTLTDGTKGRSESVRACSG